MTRYHVDAPGNLEIVRNAINDGALGPHASRVVTHMRAGVVWQEPAAAFEARCGLEPEQVVHTSRLVIGDDGSAALELPDLPGLNNLLGKVVGGVAIPRAGSLVQVARPRDHSLLPAGVRDKLDDAYVSSQLDGTDITGQAKDTPAARAAITAELQGRAPAALSRQDVRGARAALDTALGPRPRQSPQQ